MLLDEVWNICRLLVLGIMFLLGFSTSYAQNRYLNYMSVSTDMLDWALVTPNIGLDIPLSNPSYIDASSLYIEGAISLNANRAYVPYLIYKLSSGKIEYRRHFRFGEEAYKCSSLTNFVNRIAQKVTSENYWRYRRLNLVDDIGRSYIGLFAQYMDYSICLPIHDNSKGRVGSTAITGVSIGYNKPLYNFNNKFHLEWEVGTSLGVVFSLYDYYDCYENNIVGNGFWAYPMITDLHVSLVLRKHSISGMYKKTKLSGY